MKWMLIMIAASGGEMWRVDYPTEKACIEAERQLVRARAMQPHQLACIAAPDLDGSMADWIDRQPPELPEGSAQ